MKYSYNWLQTHIEEKLPDVASLKETIIFHAFEVEDVETVDDDSVLDIKVLPDRAHDALSHYGMAREIAGLLKLTLKPLELKPLPSTDLDMNVEIKSDLCRRYIAIKMDGIKVAPSPDWLKQSLETIGQKSINNIVDATNYVLFDRGQPVHAYDSASVDGGIVIRLAKEDEKIVTLSGEEKILKPDMLLIADYIGGLAIAGVKGGKNAEVFESTSSIIIEIANFDAVSIRKTSRSLGLVTDASKRFENDMSPVIAFDAAQQVVALIKELAGGEVVGVFEYFPKKPEQTKLSFTVHDITRLLGTSVTSTMIDDVFFSHYKYEYTKVGEVYTLTVPYERLDITGVHDIAEEIGRIIGYDTLQVEVLPKTFIPEHSPVYLSIRAAKQWLVEQGFKEVQTYAFAKNGEVFINRGPKNKSALRSNLSDALKESYEMNKRNSGFLGLPAIKLFEIGTVFFLDKEETHVAMIDAGVIKEVPLEIFMTEHDISADAVSLAVAGDITPFKQWSVYPFITRDVAVWVASDSDKVRLQKIVSDFAATYCVRTPVLFDMFTKEGKTSLAYRFVFQSYEKTLTESEVEPWYNELIKSILVDTAFIIR